MAQHSIIAREGKLTIRIAIVAVLLLHYWLGYFALPAWLVVLLLAWLYRDPVRSIPSRPLAIVSPVDGTVLGVEQDTDPFLKRDAQHVQIKMSALGAYSLRSVTEGKVIQQWHGKHGGLIEKGAMAAWIQTDEGDDLVIVFHAAYFAHLIRCEVSAGERIGQGQRCGHLLFGSTIELYLPIQARIEVKAGQDVLAGSDVIAELIHD